MVDSLEIMRNSIDDNLGLTGEESDVDRGGMTMLVLLTFVQRE
jgi:hypothetical protein